MYEYFKKFFFLSLMSSTEVKTYWKKERKILGKSHLLLGGGASYIFMWWANILTAPPIPLEKHTRPPQIYDKNVCDPPSPAPKTPLLFFLLL